MELSPVRTAGTEVPPRTPRPVRRFDLLAGLGAAALPSGAYVTALLMSEVPPRGAAVVLLGAAPLCGLFALAVLGVGARAEAVPGLGWASGGLVVSVVATVLQLVPSPRSARTAACSARGGRRSSATC